MSKCALLFSVAQRLFYVYSLKLQFLGHCMRKDGIEKLALTGKIAGKRARGRHRVTFLQRIAEWSEK